MAYPLSLDSLHSTIPSLLDSLMLLRPYCLARPFIFTPPLSLPIKHLQTTSTLTFEQSPFLHLEALQNLLLDRLAILHQLRFSTLLFCWRVLSWVVWDVD